MLPTREEALRRLADFVPRAGRDYAANRNYDRGAQNRANVSTLSPYLRHRLVTESEVVARVLERFELASASKFVQEVFWRTYWKGWLESRPAVWDDYLSALDARRAELATSRRLAGAYEAATNARTGIDAFDTWVRELVETGYVHNHARMWFASIWIFTLRLPWELGADFFMRYLLCGDQASNTLSWRWVAGLHTRGKTYLARRDNIRRYTEDRLDVGEALVRVAPALTGPAYPAVDPVPVPLQPALRGPALLLLHDDDAGVESLPLEPYDIRGSLALLATNGRSPHTIGERVLAFATGALGDALRRAPHGDAKAIVALTDLAAAAETISERARSLGVSEALTSFAPVGPVRRALDALRVSLAARDVRLVEVGRRYDALAWPHATRGYFGLRIRIPQILTALGIVDLGESVP
jgi:deoxyribodipyrimidine photo-lyase